jgi:hypothetical protein
LEVFPSGAGQPCVLLQANREINFVLCIQQILHDQIIQGGAHYREGPFFEGSPQPL